MPAVLDLDPEEHHHGSQPNLNWRPNPPYPHLLPAQPSPPCILPAMALPTSPIFYLVFRSPPWPRASSSPIHWWWVDVWLSVCCHAWRLLKEQRKEKKHQDTHFYWSHEHTNYTETMFHCYFWWPQDYTHQVLPFQLVSMYFFYSSEICCHANGHIRDGKQLDNWMESQCGISGMLQRALWVQSCECHKCYHKWFTDAYSKWSKNNSPTATCDSFCSYSHARQKSILEGCTSLGRSDIFWMKFSGVPSFQKV